MKSGDGNTIPLLSVIDSGVLKGFVPVCRKWNSFSESDNSIPDDEAVRSGKLGFFPDDIKNTFGLPIEEHKKAHEVVETDGYVTMAALTGNRKQR